jgi:hypothetical protein
MIVALARDEQSACTVGPPRSKRQVEALPSTWEWERSAPVQTLRSGPDDGD